MESRDVEKPIALSFFSGAMGLDNGIERAGIDIKLACENDRACQNTISENKPNLPLISDINEYSPRQIREAAGLGEKDDIDLIVGGPPCQAFSTAGKRQSFVDTRGNVFLTFIHRIIALQPKYAIIENVRGLLSAPLVHRPHSERGKGYPPLNEDEAKGGALLHVLSLLRNEGYACSFNLYNAANFGSPQKRERVIIVCGRNGKKPPHLMPTHSEDGSFELPKWRTFQDAVKGLPKDGHSHINFPEKRLRYYRLLKPGQYWRNLPLELQKEAMGGSYGSGGGKTGFFRRLAWDKPSPTLVTHPAMPATDLAHPEEDRPLSVQEYKRIQEFPDEWKITGNIIEQYKQIGNAVPVSLGLAAGKLVKSLLKEESIPKVKNFPYSRYENTSEETWERMIGNKHVQPSLLEMHQ